MKKLLSSVVFALACLPLFAQTERQFTVNITPDGAANMQVFIPEHPSGCALIACPGGGYTVLAMQNEGTDWVEFFNKQGIVYGVLTYRFPKGDPTLPISDAENAVRMMRDSAAVWGLNPHYVGIMGSSAGGHLASTIATHAPVEARPDFQILFYPVITMVAAETSETSVTALNLLGDKRHDAALIKEYTNYNHVRSNETPPALILLPADDTLVPVLTNGLPYYTALRRAGVPAAMHIYQEGGHGFGMNKNFVYHEQMLNDLSAWLSRLPKTIANAVKQ